MILFMNSSLSASKRAEKRNRPSKKLRLPPLQVLSLEEFAGEFDSPRYPELAFADALRHTYGPYYSR